MKRSHWKKKKKKKRSKKKRIRRQGGEKREAPGKVEGQNPTAQAFNNAMGGGEIRCTGQRKGKMRGTHWGGGESARQTTNVTTDGARGEEKARN